MKRKKKNKAFPFARYIAIALFIAVAAWLITSIIQKRNPLDLAQTGISQLNKNSTAALNQQIAEKDSIIAELKNKLSAYEGQRLDRRALVIIDTESLNMRNGASLDANIITKIPANSEVMLHYYDTNSYFIAGRSGQWAYISYAGQEGWVWGNYIREI